MSKQPSKTEYAFSAREGARRLRLLLSWKERLLLQPRQDTAALGIADREAAAVRKQARAAVERAAEHLRGAIAARESGVAVSEEQLDRWRHDIAQFNVLLKANASADLGGFDDLPLERYAPELGLGRKGFRIRFDRDDYITLVAAPVILVTVCLGIAWYHLWRTEVLFAIDRPNPGNVALHFQNHSNFTTYLYGPWPETNAELDRTSFGVALYCRAKGAEDFQDCTNLREAWTYQRQAISPRKPVQVETGVEVTLVLNIAALENAYGSVIEELRLECGSAGRRARFEFTEVVRQQPAHSPAGESSAPRAAKRTS